MKVISLLALLISSFALILALLGRDERVSADQINEIVDERLAQRQRELVDKCQANLQQIEKDFGLEPSNATTLEEMAQSLARIVLN